MDDLQDLTQILKSRFPLVTVQTHEESRALALLERVANLEEWPIYTWSVADGLRRVNNSEAPAQTQELTDALRHIDQSMHMGIYVLMDAHPFLENPVNQRLIKEIAVDYNRVARTLVFLSDEIELPVDLRRLSANFALSLPNADQIRQIIAEEARLWQQTAGTEKLRGQQETVNLMVQHMIGMCAEDVRRQIRQAIRDDGMITMQDVSRILRFKHEALGASGLLQLQIDCGSFADVGGQKNLKRWLDLRKQAFVQSVDGLDAPRGILLLGVQGSGKSLAAKAVAGSWGLPLLRLDFGALYNKYHGETERNLRECLKVADMMSPCVLWMDEIEKGLAPDDGGSDGGVSRRVLGTLLTWMTERSSRVFLTATANDISNLPPELLRKGRFDEIFFVDLPDAETRQEIFRIHLRRRLLPVEAFDVPALSAAADGFSGAEIEQSIVAALYEAKARNEAPATAHVVDEIKRTRPLSVVMAEQVQKLRDWASQRTVSAN